MEGLFHDEQRLKRDEQDRVVGVTASGPLRWGDGETSARIEASIWKDGVEVARGSTGDVPSSEAEWRFDAPLAGDAALEPGDATGRAKAFVQRAGSADAFEWETKVRLV